MLLNVIIQKLIKHMINWENARPCLKIAPKLIKTCIIGICNTEIHHKVKIATFEVFA